MKRLLLLLTATLLVSFCKAAESDYKTSEGFLALRDSMYHAFNDGDSARFFPAIKSLLSYLEKQNDPHAYYTQRCNVIVFLMNQKRIFEAYKLARELSAELREKKLDKEMYMATNMLGHINRYCGNDEEAKENWRETLRMMEEAGYYSSMPPIYMNIVNATTEDSIEETDSLLAKALEIARKYSPDRVFDIETRQTISYFYRGDYPKFVEGYKAYKAGEAEGKSSVHGRELEVFYLSYLGKTDEAINLARKEFGDEGKDVIVILLEKAGRWKDAFLALKEQTASEDSIDNVVLINSMKGIRDELVLYDAYRQNHRTKMIGLTAALALMGLLIFALFYIVQSRRKHMKELQKAYRRATESEKMKAAFIQNVSHEVRTPLNIISGFSQVIADPELTDSVEERQHMSEMMQKSAHQITSLIDEIIGLSLIESTEKMRRNDSPCINRLLKDFQRDYQDLARKGVSVKVETSLADDFTIKTNENMLKRIIAALMENAVKYTEEGCITLKASADEKQLRVTIEDTGCGIPADQAENVFGRFVKLDSFKEGIGLGLPLSRKLAEQLDGNVILDTKYTQGARFIVTLPII